jgi:tRNA/tmRNA/rRNA uracil-C5-methylase (TrmA/RlmC/RlmD family)
MEKNEVYEIKIDDIGNDGEGIGHVDGMAAFLMRKLTKNNIYNNMDI